MNRLVTGTVVALAAGAVVAGTAAGAGAAGADIETSEYVAQNCIGLSPNIIDNPYYGGVTVYPDGNGRISVTWGNPSIWGYRTDGTLTWKNLRTGRSGQSNAHFTHDAEGAGSSAEIATGPGPVRITTRAMNRGPFLTLAAPTCTGVAHVR